MKVTVVGGLGYIGAKLAKHLSERGHEVFILDHYNAKIPPEVANLPISRGDITDPETLKRIDIRGHDAVLHLAAQSSGPKSFEIPDVDIKINVLGTLNVLNWMKSNMVKRILFASSFVVYGDPAEEMVNEEFPCNPKSVYATSKLACEHLMKVYAAPHGIKWNVMRLFSVYGPGQDITRADQGIVGIFMNMVKTSTLVSVKGSLARFRDLVHIDDVVQAWTLCLENNTQTDKTYNVASGEKTTIASIVDNIIDSMGRRGEVDVKEAGVTPGDVMGCYADISQIQKDLGYRPKFSAKTGIANMVQWMKDV
jgi:UDP-glucose 4-epimerase